MANAAGGEVVYLELSDFHQAAAEALGIDLMAARTITRDFEKYPEFATKPPS